MPKYRVHLAVRRPDNKGGGTVTVNVEADFDFTAMEMARQQYYQTHPLNRDEPSSDIRRTRRVEKVQERTFSTSC